MKPIAILGALTFALAANPTLADECHDRIAAMFDGGALDPFTRPPHRYTNTVTNADGMPLYVYDVVFETPVRSIAGIRGVGPYSMVVDSETWTGPGLDGPWTATPGSIPDNHAGHQRKLHLQQLANLADTSCPGTMEIDGQNYLNVQFFTKTDSNPDMGGSWFGSRHSVFIDENADTVMRWELTDFVNSWSEGVTKDSHVLIYEYDPTIAVIPPAQ